MHISQIRQKKYSIPNPEKPESTTGQNIITLLRNFNQMVEHKLLQKTCEAIKVLYGQTIDPKTIGLEKTKKEIEGDFTIIVFPFTRISHKSPEITANEIGGFLLQHIPQIKSFTVIKGFLNIILQNIFWLDFITKNCLNSDFGLGKQNQNRPIVLEYSSPNTNKPLHLGHIRNNLLGFSLSKILTANGYKVVKVNLVNDRGIHICKSMLAYTRWGNDETPESSGIKGDHLIGKYYVLFEKHYREEIKNLMEKGLTEEEAMRQAPLIEDAQDLLRRWEAKDPNTVDLWAKMNNWAYSGFQETYRNLGVDFDKYYYESKTYLLGKKLVLDGLKNGKLFQKEDGSIWADLTEEGLDEKLLLRADGTSVYMTQDLGTAQLRYEEFHPSKMIYVVGNEQNYHFDVLGRILSHLGKSWASHIYHLSYGMVELPHGKMKSREGTVVDADDLMDEMNHTAERRTRELGKVTDFSGLEATILFRMIGSGALKYFILKVDPKKNMLFDPEESIDFNGNTGPFIQYTHARIQSLLKKARENGFDNLVSGFKPDLSILGQEKVIIKMLYQFPSIIKQAGDELNPAVVANYVFELAKEYNQFYQEIPILKANETAVIQFRLRVSYFTGETIKRSLSLLGIDVPDRM